MAQSKRYNSFAAHTKAFFGERVQKISINAGFTCPNRDGTRGKGGCLYCNNQSFYPPYCNPKDGIKAQITKGIDFFRPKYNAQKYIAFFQAFSNTYAPIEQLEKMYLEALDVPEVVGLIISTRPDCVDKPKLDFLEELNRKHYISVEYGIESCYDDMLDRLNRCHTFSQARWAIEETAKRGISVGGHLMFGLFDMPREKELAQAGIISRLPLSAIKMHQLQIHKNTQFAKQYAQHPERFNLFGADEYLNFVVDFIERLSPDIMIERFVSQTTADRLIAPRWDIKNFEFVAKVEKLLEQRNSWQGKNYFESKNCYSEQ